MKKEHDAMTIELKKEKVAKVELEKKIDNLKVEKLQAVCQKNVTNKILKDFKQGRDGNK